MHVACHAPTSRLFGTQTAMFKQATTGPIHVLLAALISNQIFRGKRAHPRCGSQAPPACGSGWGAASTQTRRVSRGRHRRGGTRLSAGGEDEGAGVASVASFPSSGQLPGLNNRSAPASGCSCGPAQLPAAADRGVVCQRACNNSACRAANEHVAGSPAAVPCGNLGRLCRCSGSAGGPAA